MDYQRITVLISEQNKAVPFLTNADNNFKFVKKVSAYTSPILSENKSTIKFSKDFKINGKLIFPSDFDIYVLHPVLVATEKDYKYKNAKAEGSSIEGEVIDTAIVSAPYYLTIIIGLDNEPPKEEISHKLNQVIEELGKLNAK